MKEISTTWESGGDGIDWWKKQENKQKEKNAQSRSPEDEPYYILFGPQSIL